MYIVHYMYGALEIDRITFSKSALQIRMDRHVETMNLQHQLEYRLYAQRGVLQTLNPNR